MTERCNANLLEVLISQVTQNGELNMVLGKTLCVLGHAELFEPLCNLMHWRPPRIYRYPFWTGTGESLPQAPTYRSAVVGLSSRSSQPLMCQSKRNKRDKTLRLF